jgi:hypothetical protein
MNRLWLLLVLAPLTAFAGDHSRVYVTWAGAEPDKGASAWYIKRHVDRDAVFEVVPHGSLTEHGTAFDTPYARFRRIHNASTLETLLREYPSNDPTIQKLAQLTHDIEINLWRPKQFPASVALEARIKDIDSRFGGTGVPMDCFIEFFDRVYAWLAAGTLAAEAPAAPRICRPDGKDP